ncbi:MAG: hypothetical protein Q7S34_00740 [bacterium]|nr:hypothetical protein [bacterium]
MKKKIVKKGKVVKTKPTSGKKHMVSVSGERCFWINNGPILSNLKDLHNALRAMSDEQWKYHVRKDRNDFVVWVKAVLGDSACATKLVKCKTKLAAAKVVSKAVAEY